MTNEEYQRIAIEKTIKLLKEQGLKYRISDFDNYLPNHVYTFGSTVACIVAFAYGERGKKLKDNKLKFLNYFNARVQDDRIRFEFSHSELDLETVGAVDSSVNSASLDKIMEKINKLLALSNSKCNEHEAIAASMMAQKLLAKYNLDISDITGQDKKEDIENCITDVTVGHKWKYALAGVIANSYCCKSYFQGSDRIIFYGYKSDILIARRVFVYLFEVGNKLAKAYEKEQRDLYGTASGIYNSFCKGFVQGINEQLAKQCKALMLVVPKEVNEEWEGFSAKFGTKDTQLSVNDAEAYDNGKIEGKRALNAQYLDK